MEIVRTAICFQLISGVILISERSYAQLDHIITLEQEAKKAQLWWPSIPIRKMLEWNPWNVSEEMDRADDEDPGTSFSMFRLRWV